MIHRTITPRLEKYKGWPNFETYTVAQWITEMYWDMFAAAARLMMAVGGNEVARDCSPGSPPTSCASDAANAGQSWRGMPERTKGT